MLSWTGRIMLMHIFTLILTEFTIDNIVLTLIKNVVLTLIRVKTKKKDLV